MSSSSSLNAAAKSSLNTDSAMASSSSSLTEAKPSLNLSATISSGSLNTKSDSPQSPTHEFLQFCYRCKNHLNHRANIFMYGDFRGFCSVRCRDQQVRVDETEKTHGQKKKN